MGAARNGIISTLERRGLFLSFEGVDGSGKTTQLERLAARFESSGIDFIRAQEPGGTPIGAEIRRILLDSKNAALDPTAELLLYFASRAQNIAQVIRPALEQGRVVVADRFTDATVAYQGYGRELGAETVIAIDKIACRGLQPDLTLWLDIAPNVSVRRALARQETIDKDESRMEREGRAFFERVRQGYQALLEADPQRIKRIDASGSIEKVEAAIDAAVAPVLDAYGHNQRHAV